ncbi:MAG TPA: aspartate racemase [Geobacter sp.]|nr:aspartate racemase [Geobacter sp.]
MKTIGIVGGVGPESTVDYYQRIIKAFHVPGSLAAPEIIIYSVNLEEVLDLVGKREWNHLIYLLGAKIKSLHKAGAEFAVISANTPHVVFDEVQAKSPIPLISIVTATLDKAKELGVKKVGLLGTRFTMEENFFSPPFAASGISVVVPNPADQAYIHQKLIDEIELGVFKDETREGLLAIVKRMMETDAIDAVILGCTELPLILQRDEFGIPFLNTTAIHVESMVRFCLR